MDEGNRFDLRVHRPRHGMALVLLSGDLDADVLPRFARLFTESVGELDASRVVLDLDGVRSLVPEAIDVLVTAERQVQVRGGTVEMLAPSPEVVLLLHDAATREPCGPESPARGEHLT